MSSLLLALLIIAILLGVAGAFVKALLWVAVVILLVDVILWGLGRMRKSNTGV